MAFERRGPAAWVMHPGEILQVEFLKPMKMSGYRLAQSLKVKPQTVNDITLGKRGVSADMAIRLAKFFGTTEQFWMNLQAAYELGKARKEIKKDLDKIQPVNRAA